MSQSAKNGVVIPWGRESLTSIILQKLIGIEMKLQNLLPPWWLDKGFSFPITETTNARFPYASTFSLRKDAPSFVPETLSQVNHLLHCLASDDGQPNSDEEQQYIDVAVIQNLGRKVWNVFDNLKLCP